jgi:hypothetical protein
MPYMHLFTTLSFSRFAWRDYNMACVYSHQFSCPQTPDHKMVFQTKASYCKRELGLMMLFHIHSEEIIRLINKFDSKSLPCIFTGYTNYHNCYKYYYPPITVTYVSSNKFSITRFWQTYTCIHLKMKASQFFMSRCGVELAFGVWGTKLKNLEIKF